MSNVLLVNPPSPFLIDQAVFPPLNLLYLTASLRRAGHSVDVVDMATGRSIEGYSPDLVGIGALTPHIPMLRSLIDRIKGLYGNIPTVFGGAHFTNRPEDGLALGGTVCRGDGERSILKVLAGDSGLLEDVMDLDRDGIAPDRTAVNLWDYHYQLVGQRATSLLTCRGCPYACAYCSRGLGIDTVRYVPLRQVLEELDDIRAAGFGAVNLYDDEINLSTSRLEELCEVLKVYKMKWRGFVRANLFTERQAELLAEAGCVEVCCGVESGSDYILKKVNKKATVADCHAMVRKARDAGLRVKLFCMIGLPGETEETAQATKQFILDARPDDFDICPFTPYPGSAVFADPERYGITVEKSYWTSTYNHKGKPGEYHVMIHTEKLSSDRIEELRDEIERDCRLELEMPPL